MPVYLDHAASAPIRPRAAEAWLAAITEQGNASSTHGTGQHMRRLLEDARERVAVALDCEPIEVIFTSGGTESINLALQGLWNAHITRIAAPDTHPIVLPDGEHHATLDTVTALAAAGAQVRAVPLTRWGRIDPAVFAEALPGAALATALIANNEVGTINDAEALATAAATAGVPLHLDAVGAVGYLPVSFRALRGSAARERGTGLVALSVAGHKLGAPVGTGVLVVARDAQLAPLLHGGGQQRSLRPGTQDVPGALAFATAIEDALAERDAEHERQQALRDRLVEGIRSAVPQAELLGDPHDRLPGNAHFLFPDAPSESLLFLLDQAGFSASAGSACQAGVGAPSHVVRAMGRTEAEARSVVRFTVGRTTTHDEIEALLGVIREAYLRASGARAAARS